MPVRPSSFGAASPKFPTRPAPKMTLRKCASRCVNAKYALVSRICYTRWIWEHSETDLCASQTQLRPTYRGFHRASSPSCPFLPILAVLLILLTAEMAILIVGWYFLLIRQSQNHLNKALPRTSSDTTCGIASVLSGIFFHEVRNWYRRFSTGETLKKPNQKINTHIEIIKTPRDICQMPKPVGAWFIHTTIG